MKGDINLLEEYPILFFNCSELKIKKNFLKNFQLKQKKKMKIKFKVEGQLNIINKKINFKN